MKFMATWKIPPASYKQAVVRFLKTGAPAPAGVESLGRWHAPGSSRGWHLLEGDPAAIAHLHAQWADALEIEITPVIDDEAAAASLAAAHGD